MSLIRFNQFKFIFHSDLHQFIKATVGNVFYMAMKAFNEFKIRVII